MKKEISVLDFRSHIQQASQESLKSLWLHSEDESVVIFHRQLIKEAFGIETWSLISAKEVTIKWLEDHMAALTLFADETPIVILEAEKLKKNVFERLCEGIPDSSKKVFLFSSGKTDLPRTKTFASLFEVEYLKLKMPAFWDYDKLVQYIFEAQGFKLDGKSAHYLCMRLGQNFYEFQNAAKVCQLNYPESKALKLDDLKELFKSNKHIDRFRLAELFNKKQLSNFFSELMNSEVDQDEMKSFFSFMIGHCVKMVDPGYANEKKKISKYDREIQQAAKTWNSKQLDYMLDRFSELVIMCKQKKEISKELEKSFLSFSQKGA